MKMQEENGLTVAECIEFYKDSIDEAIRFAEQSAEYEEELHNPQ